MNKVQMKGFTVHNVEPCPKCNSDKYARRDEVMGMVIMCCDECDYEADGCLIMRGSVSLAKNRKGFIEVTRAMFNHWNESIANQRGDKPKRVRIINDK